MKVIPFDKQKEPTTDDMVINYFDHRHKIAKITGFAKMSIFMSSLAIFLLILYSFMAFGIPSFVSTFFGG